MEFDLNEGFKVQTYEEIRVEKKTKREQTFGVTITDSPTSIYANIDYVNSKGEEELQLKIQAIDQKMKTFFSNIQNRIANVNVSTYNSILQGLKKLDYVDQVSVQIPTNIENGKQFTAGTISIYLLLKEREEYNDSRLNEVASQIHSLIPVGAFTNQETDNTRARSGETVAFSSQKVTYSWADPIIKYAYVKIVYKASTDEYLGFQTDSNMREALEQMLEDNGYNLLGKDFEYQEFIASIINIQGIGYIDISLHLDDDPNKDINSFEDSDFTTVNENIVVGVDTLYLFDLKKRLIITISPNQTDDDGGDDNE